MSDWRWCAACEARVRMDEIDECQSKDCPMQNQLVDTSDELHQILGKALGQGSDANG